MSHRSSMFLCETTVHHQHLLASSVVAYLKAQLRPKKRHRDDIFAFLRGKTYLYNNSDVYHNRYERLRHW